MKNQTVEYGYRYMIGEWFGSGANRTFCAYEDEEDWCSFDLTQAATMTWDEAQALLPRLVRATDHDLELVQVKEVCRFIYNVKAVILKGIPKLETSTMWLPNITPLGPGQFDDLDEARAYLKKKKGEYVVWHQERISELMKANFTTDN